MSSVRGDANVSCRSGKKLRSHCAHGWPFGRVVTVQNYCRDGFAYRLQLHVTKAGKTVPSITGKSVTPHVLRHSCAMHTLQATGDVRKVALWLGHTSIQTTEMYLRSDPTEKLALLDAHHAPLIKPGRFREPSDKLMQILAAATQRS